MPLTARQRSIHNKNGPKRSTSFKTKRSRKDSEGEYLFSSAPTNIRTIYYPGGALTLTLLLTARLASAFWGHISDCDETYNYWEPLHYLVYGNGLQSWEYSPQYAIRSYMPLWLFAVPAKILSQVLTPVTVFYTLRVLLAVLTAGAEFMFYKAVCHEFGVNIGRMWLFMALPAAGCFACSAAMLPSAWSSALVSAALACWWRKRYAFAILFTAITTLLSWPFTALLGLPIAIDMLIMKRKIVEFLKWALLFFVIILAPTVALDSWHYGRLVVAPWNIVAYNIFTEHGPDLYGVEPWTYYFINGFLNFNVVWILALFCPLVLFLCSYIYPLCTNRASFCIPYWLSMMPLALWLVVFMIQPHKEERFLYPVYSMIVLAGALTVDCMQRLGVPIASELFGFRLKCHYLSFTGPFMIMYTALATVGGIARILALYNNYHSPMIIMSPLPDLPGDVIQNVCFGKDWYRSPSSFHLPPGYRMRFVQSEFSGQLPAPYDSSYNATRIIHTHFNDMNKGNNQTYLTPEQCHYLVDSDVGSPTPLQPQYYKQDMWEIVESVPLLDAERSHKVFRAFFVPVLSNVQCTYGHLYLLRNKMLIR